MLHLAEEKELTRRSDDLARKRQALPWVAVEREYPFETEDGRARAATPGWPCRHDEYERVRGAS